MDVHGHVKSTYLELGDTLSDSPMADYKWLVEQEVDSWKHWVSVSPSRRVWLWRHGFLSPHDELYDLDTHGPEAYLSPLQRYRLYNSLNGDHRYLVDDKLCGHWMLSDYPENRPSAYGLIDRGYVYGIGGSELDGEPVPVSEWLPSTLREESKLVIKELRGSSGSEVYICEYDDGYTLDGEPISEGELRAKAGDMSGYLVTDYVDQHAYADELYPHAANTLRLLTIWDHETGELFTPIAVQRIGTDLSRPIDNGSQGGLTAEIDIETGELGKGAQYPFWEGEVPWYARHPDTGARIEGARIPEWDAVLSRIEAIARDNAHIPIIGWDVVIDESGEPVVVEANTGTVLRNLQIHRPLLADDRVARVAARHLSEVEYPAVEGR